MLKKGFSKEEILEEKTYRQWIANKYSNDEILNRRRKKIESPLISILEVSAKTNEKNIDVENFDNAAYLYLKIFENDNSRKASSYRNCILTHVLPYFKKYKINDINREDVVEFMNYKLKQGYTYASIRKCVYFLNKINQSYSKYPKIFACSLVESVFTSKRESLSIDEIKRLLKEKSIISLWFIYLGLKLEELLALEYSDIDFKHHKIYIGKVHINNEIVEYTNFYQKRSLFIPNILFEKLDKTKKGLIFNHNDLKNIDAESLINTHVKLMLEKNIQINLIAKNMGIRGLSDFASKYSLYLPQQLDKDFNLLQFESV